LEEGEDDDEFGGGGFTYSVDSKQVIIQFFTLLGNDAIYLVLKDFDFFFEELEHILEGLEGNGIYIGAVCCFLCCNSIVLNDLSS